VGLWSYQPTAANQHIFDDFLVQNLGQGYLPGANKVRAVENKLVKLSHRGNELRKAQLLQAPPAGQVWRSYYFAGSARIAMRVQVNGSGDQVYYLLADHLGSTTVSYRSDGGETRYQSYKPWGELRGGGNSLPTDRTYTGQRWDSYINLHWYGSRWYDDQLGRWVQPDWIVPEAAQGVQAWDRYSYSNNSPLVYSDPSGHCIFGIDTIICVALAGAAIGAAVGYGAQVINNYQNGSSNPWTENISAEPIVGGAVLGTGAVLVAPAAIAVAGDVLVGTSLVTGSTALFGAGMSAYNTAATIEQFYVYGTTLPVLKFDPQKFPNIAPHIQDAQTAGQPSVLTRTTNPVLMSNNRAEATGGLVGLDEYPFASTYEGGAGASVRIVPAGENRLQGLQIAHFYFRNQIRDGDKFKVIPK
jgi:RHS repeat-associated protein